jgi:hypothetical protein
VLNWVKGHLWEADELHYAFYATRFGRTLDKLGYVRFRQYRLYSEPGLARRRVAVWLYGEQITVAFDETLLAQYTAQSNGSCHQPQSSMVIRPETCRSHGYTPPVPRQWTAGSTLPRRRD